MRIDHPIISPGVKDGTAAAATPAPSPTSPAAPPGRGNARNCGSLAWREPQPRQPGKEDRQRHLHFKTRQRCADAEMNAGTEGDMGEERPGRIEAGRVGIAGGIAIGGAEEEADLLAFLQPDAGDLTGFKGIAVEEMQRRVEAEASSPSPPSPPHRRTAGRYPARTRGSPLPRCRSHGPSPRGRH